MIALGQYAYLLVVSARLRRQLRDGARLRDDNPLGRVLAKVQTLRQGLVPGRWRRAWTRHSSPSCRGSSGARRWSSCWRRWPRCWGCSAP